MHTIKNGSIMNLKELTWENHKKAERKKFAGILMSGQIEPSLYYKYLYNQVFIYALLENALQTLGFPEELSGVYRAMKIRDDINELETEFGVSYNDGLIMPSTGKYLAHIEKLYEERDLDSLVAHMYVRHFGDMYGGAMIAKRIPGSGTMYEFENKEELKQKLRDMLDDEMADEANKCFEFAIKLFEELGDSLDV